MNPIFSLSQMLSPLYTAGCKGTGWEPLGQVDGGDEGCFGEATFELAPG
jgi:hypothetical protein